VFESVTEPRIGAAVPDPGARGHPAAQLPGRLIDQAYRFGADQLTRISGRQRIRRRVELAVAVALKFLGTDVIGREAALSGDRIGTAIQRNPWRVRTAGSTVRGVTARYGSEHPIL
jgi:hypothetical protein